MKHLLYTSRSNEYKKKKINYPLRLEKMFKMCAHDNIEKSLELIRLYAIIPT